MDFDLWSFTIDNLEAAASLVDTSRSPSLDLHFCDQSKVRGAILCGTTLVHPSSDLLWGCPWMRSDNRWPAYKRAKFFGGCSRPLSPPLKDLSSSLAASDEPMWHPTSVHLSRSTCGTFCRGHRWRGC